MNKHQVIIVGAGAAGVAASTRLLRGGIRDFVILEAEDRIGGRIHSIPLDGATADLGAQWVHGDEGNVVYSMANPLGLLEDDRLMVNWAGATFHTEDGSKLDTDLQALFYGWLHDIDATCQTKLKGFQGSLGHYYIQEYEARLAKCKRPVDHNLARSFLAWYEQFEDSIDAADTWFDTSGSGHLAYIDIEGNLLNMWKSGGYHSILTLLINQLEKPEDFHSRVQFNKEVTTISWGDAGVKVTCKDGSVLEADKVVLTVSLGVLKERARNMFYPALPPSKLNAIQGLAIGTVDKILLTFPHPWWTEDCAGFGMLWTKQETDLPPHQGWLRYVFGFFTVTGLPNTLCGWVVGAAARHMELLSDREVTEGCMMLLRKFLSSSYQVPDCTQLIRSKWYSNPHFRGSYSFRSMETDLLETDASHLASPLCDSTGKPVLMFAGEASHDGFFSTVHGAIETGWREADRILNMARGGAMDEVMTKHEVIIVGAGMAGLGAARTLLAAGISDFVILEAQDRAGGRAFTEDQDLCIEQGAQWIHGEHSNVLYQLASEHNLLSDLEFAEGLGPYFLEDGTEVPPELVAEVAQTVENILESCEKFCRQPGLDIPPSVGTFLREQFHASLEGCDPQQRKLRLLLFEWHLKFQEIDNSCDTMDKISAFRWGRYSNCAGRDYNSLTRGFTSLVNLLTSQLPRNSLQLSSEVATIRYRTHLEAGYLSPHTRRKLGMMVSDWDPPVIVACRNGKKYGGQHVIVTASLGVLKLCHSNMFLPALPAFLTKPIEDLGFGNIAKIYLVYDEPWWKPEEKGFQLVWSSSSDDSQDPEMSWMRDMTGFDVLPGEHHVLLGWVGAEGSRQAEVLPRPKLAQHCTFLLQKVLRRPVPAPTKVFRSQWYSNVHVRGSYSHTTDRCDQSGTKPEDLLQPVIASCPSLHLQLPVVMLAGEAAHPTYFSTTHGAYETGVTQAQKIVSAMSPTHKAKY